MNVNRIRELRSMAAELRRQTALTPEGPLPKSIVALESMINQTPVQEIDDVIGVLVDECVRASRFDLELKFRRQLVEMLPNDVLARCSLAECISRGGTSDDKAACEYAAEAVELARRKNEYVRYALTTELRLALAKDDYERVNAILRELIADAELEREHDYVFEQDFISALDRSKVDAEALAAYMDIAAPTPK